MPAYKPFRDQYGRFAPRPAAARAKAAPKEEGILFKELRESFRNEVGGKRGECHYAIILKNGALKRHIQDVCHARLYGEEGTKGVILDARQHYDELVNAENNGYFVGSDVAYRAWMEWLVNESPFAEAFITKDFEEALKYGYLLDASKGISLIYCAAIAMRTAHEFNHILNSWWHMRDWNISPLTRFFLAHCLNQQEEHFSVTCRQGHHVTFSSRCHIGVLAKVVKSGKMHFQGVAFNSGHQRGACHTPFTGDMDRYSEDANSLYKVLLKVCKPIPGEFQAINGIRVKDAKKILTPLIDKLEGK